MFKLKIKIKAMKTIKYVIILALIIALGACSTIVKFPLSEIAPAADGRAMIKTDKNKNYVIDVKIKYLAKADRLNPPRQHYIVWISTENEKAINIGMLVSDKKNNASLRGVSSSKPTQIFITAEDDNNIKWPGNQELFRIQDIGLQ